MAAPKGNKFSPGRPKGAKNKVPKDLVQQILDLAAELEEKGKGLTACANENPKWFCENFLKGLIPKNINVDTQATIILQAADFKRKEPDA